MMSANTILNRVFADNWMRPCVVASDHTFTYGELHAHALGLAEALKRHGCRAGDAIGLRLANGWPFVVSYLACMLGKFQAVPVNQELNDDDQRYILQRLRLKTVLVDPEEIIKVDPIPTAVPQFSYPEGQVFAVFFTSGTTGRPKGVCHTLEAMVANVSSFNRCLGLDSATRMYHVLPMAYMAGFLNTLLSPWVAGGTVLVGPRFRPADALDFWSQPLAWQANAIWVTPTLAAVLVRVSRSVDVRRSVAGSFQHVFCGTAPLPLATRHKFRSTFDLPLQESYGMSEVLLVSAQTRVEAESREGVGTLLPEVEVRSGVVEGRSEREVIVYTPFVLQKYIMESTEISPLLPDGGMPSGDVGELKDRNLRITGRLKDLIIRGGLNVSPVAVENVLLRERGVQEVAVVGTQHEFWGEQIVACLVPEKDADRDRLLQSLQRRCVNELGEGMRPDRFLWLDELPRSVTGKVQKHVLRERVA